jgi:hypothetical protein
MRRKGEASGLMNERDFPHLVELPLPPDGFRNVSSEFDAFHRERGIPLRRGRGCVRQNTSIVASAFLASLMPMLFAIGSEVSD